MSTSPSSTKSSNSAPPPQLHLRKTRYSSSTSTSTSSSSPFQTPLHPSHASSVPFSWEKSPGIPKLPRAQSLIYTNKLPLPPPIRSESFSSIKFPKSDPFSIALEECAKEPVQLETHPWITGRPAKTSGGKRFWVADRFVFGAGLSELYGSCKSSCDVADATVGIKRVGPYRVLNSRRVG